MEWFNKAIEGNCPEAHQNIGAIRDEYDYERQQRIQLENYLNQYK